MSTFHIIFIVAIIGAIASVIVLSMMKDHPGIPHERENIFTPSIIDFTIASLKSEKDADIHKKLAKLKGASRVKFINKLIQKDIHKN